MKIVTKIPEKTADVSSARGSNLSEFSKMILSAIILLVAIYLGIGWAVDRTVARISYHTEARLFSNFQLGSQKPVAADSADALTQANAILDRLRSAGDVPPLPYQLQLIELEAPNAFAIPGGTIGITRGLLERLNDDIEIAFVLGHEIGHFHHRDHLKGLGRRVGFSIISAVIFEGSPGSDSFRDIAEFVFQRNYSQEREELADRYGIELVHRAYGEVDGCDRLFQILQQDGLPPAWTYMFATHPDPAQRIRKLQEFARTL